MLQRTVGFIAFASRFIRFSFLSFIFLLIIPRPFTPDLDAGGGSCSWYYTTRTHGSYEEMVRAELDKD